MKLKLNKKYKRSIERQFIENFYKICPKVLLGSLGYELVQDSNCPNSYICETDTNKIVKFRFDREEILFWYLELRGCQISSGESIIDMYSFDKGCAFVKLYTIWRKFCL